MRTDGNDRGDTRLGGVASLRWAAPAAIVAIALAALWPPIVNGGPFLMADTPSYIRAAASGFYKVFGIKTAWVEEYLRLYAGASPSAATSATSSVSAASAGQVPVTLSGRSIFYGVVVYLSHLAGSLWLIVLAQSLLAASSIFLTAKSIARAAGAAIPNGTAVLIGVAAALITPLGFFAGYLMPDIFGGFALLATANLLFLWDWQSRGQRSFWFLLLGYSMLAHSVNVMLVGALVAAALVYAPLRKIPVRRAQLMGLAACGTAAVLGQWVFGQAVASMTGAKPVRPPFVAMRLIADGPGLTYLRDHCSTEKYIYCRVLDQQVTHSDVLLWSRDPNLSLFRGLTPDEQRLSAAEQPRFIRAVAAEHPGAVASTVMSNSIGQLFDLEMSGFNYSSENRARFRDTIPPDVVRQIEKSRAYRNAMPTGLVTAASAIAALLGAVLLMAFAVLDRELERRSLRAYCLCLLAGVAINAALCGALSGPKGRYEMRLIWVLPVAALSIGAAAAQRRRRATAA